MMMMSLIGSDSATLGAATAKNKIAAKRIALSSILNRALEASKNAAYQIPSPEELNRFKSAFDEILTMTQSGKFSITSAVTDSLDEIGMTITRVRTKDRRFFVAIHEKADRVEGRGIFFISEKPRDSRPVLLQTPHARSDLYSSSIGLELIEHTSACALFSSTVQRNVKMDSSDPNSPEGMADLAHTENTFFHVATRAMVDRHPDLMVLQIHGFKDRPVESLTHGTDLVVSPATQRPRHPMFWERVIRTLKSALHPIVVGEFGADVSELGAFSNVQARYVNEQSSGIFMHLELSYSYRVALMENSSARETFCKAMQQVITLYETSF